MQKLFAINEVITNLAGTQKYVHILYNIHTMVIATRLSNPEQHNTNS